MTTKPPLTIAQVDALFAGTLKNRATHAPRTATSVAWVARYDRCAECRSMTPALLSFSGDTDWDSTIALDDPIRDAIRHLRGVTGKRTILLCPRCVDELRQYQRPDRRVVVSDRLFDL